MSIEMGLKRLQRLFIEFREGNPGLPRPTSIGDGLHAAGGVYNTADTRAVLAIC
jgi:hypothetical protein